MQNTECILSTTYFGPVQWYQKLYRYSHVLIEQYETFPKQTYRNRCLIATTNGVQALTVPVHHASEPSSLHPSPVTLHQKISDHGNWRHLHWQALQSAYGESPFFEYYEDDLRPFFTERNWEYLIDYNDAICRKMCELLDIHPNISLTKAYTPSAIHLPLSTSNDFREAINPKHPIEDAEFTPRPYYQVYQKKHGFLPNLSILDLLLNMGPESIFFL